MKGDLVTVVFKSEARCDAFIEMLRREEIAYTAHRVTCRKLVVICTAKVKLDEAGRVLLRAPYAPKAAR